MVRETRTMATPIMVQEALVKGLRKRVTSTEGCFLFMMALCVCEEKPKVPSTHQLRSCL